MAGPTTIMMWNAGSDRDERTASLTLILFRFNKHSCGEAVKIQPNDKIKIKDVQYIKLKPYQIIQIVNCITICLKLPLMTLLISRLKSRQNLLGAKRQVMSGDKNGNTEWTENSKIRLLPQWQNRFSRIQPKAWPKYLKISAQKLIFGRCIKKNARLELRLVLGIFPEKKVIYEFWTRLSFLDTLGSVFLASRYRTRKRERSV